MRANGPEPFYIGANYDTRQPPTPEEINVGIKAEVTRFRLELLLPRRLPAQPLK